jgi:hypothetical protein
VKTGHHGNFAIGYRIDQTIRESTNSGPAKLPPHDLVLKWVLLDCRESMIHRVHEIGTDTRTAFVIPVARFGDLCLSLRFETKLSVHL